MYAAAKNYSIGKKRKGTAANGSRRGGEDWQDLAWDFYDTIGEYRYAVDWVGNLLSRAILSVTENGSPTQNQAALDAMAALFGGEDGQAEMLRQLGIHYTVAGEAYIVGVEEKDEDLWFVIAATEVSRSGSNTFKVKDLDIEITEDGSLVMRLWRAHPRRLSKSNAPTRAVLPILAEIEKLTMHVAAQLDSRLAGAGLLLLPSEMTFPVVPGSRPANPELPDGAEVATPSAGGAQQFIDMLIDVMSTAIGDRKDASAFVPIVLQVAGEYLEKVQHLTFWSELDEKAIELRTEAIRRLALGMDMPPEVLTGTADVNHWGAWAIDESAIKAHSEPLLKAILSALSEGYLRPVLEATGMEPEEAATFAIAADTSQLRMRPNRSKESVELYEHGELKASTMRRENGFDEEDAPDDDERMYWLIRKVASGSATPEQVAAALELLGIKIVSADQGEDLREAPSDPSIREHPVQEPPNGGIVPTEVAAVAEVMVYRALERAGNRLKNRVGGKIGDIAARDLYLHMPALTSAEATSVLEDAWSCTEWTSLPVLPEHLATVLDHYTHMLLTLHKPHDRALLELNLSELFRPALVAL